MKAPTARQVLVAGILAGLLAGCAGTPTAPSSTLGRDIQTQIDNLPNLVALERDAALVGLMQRLNAQGDYAEALSLALQYPVAPSSIEAYPSFQLSTALAQFRTGNAAQAQRTISATLSEPQAFVGLADEINLIRLRVQVRDALSLDMAAFDDQVYLSTLLPATENGQVLNELWQRAKRLADQAPSESNSLSAGWLELAAAGEDIRALQSWLQRWPDHPALDNLPLEIADLLNTDWPMAQRVGVILPLSGPLSRVGESVLDGILQQQLSVNGPALVVVDGAPGIEGALAELQGQQVDLILGPLPKDQVSALLELNPPQAVLALNYIDGELDESLAPRALMGLAPEDGARDAAYLMASENPKAPLVLVPGDTRGERVSEAFIESWMAYTPPVEVMETTGLPAPIGLDLPLPGELVPQADTRPPMPIVQRYLNDDQNQVVADALGISASRARHRALQQQLGLELEFTPRRRQDIGSVYIYADAITAAQLKPLLAFYYAGDLPIWLADAALDENLPLVRGDLTGARVVAMPWQVADSESSNVLFELGADAWRLSSALADKTQLQIAGRTGTWQREGERLRRTLTPVRITRDGFQRLDRPVELAGAR